MDIKKFSYIVEIIKQGNISAAARKLYVSQPALSQVLAQVENELGAPLIERKTKPLTLTYAGEVFVRNAQIILDQYEYLLREMDEILEEDAGRISLGIVPELVPSILKDALSALKAEHPKVELQLIEGQREDLLEKLRRREADFIILPNLSTSLYQSQVLYKEHLQFVRKKDEEHSYFKNEITLRDLAEEPLILLPEGNYIRSILDRLFVNQELVPNILMESSSAYTAVQVARSGVGGTVLPSHIAKSLTPCNDFLFLDIVDGPTWEVSLAYNKGHYITKAESTFLDQIINQKEA